MAATVRESGSTARLSQLRLLLVEDNPADADLITDYLEHVPGYDLSILRANSLREAIDACGRDAPDAVLLDLNLPDSSGPDTVQVLRRHVPCLPIVVLTGIADQQLRRQAIDHGAYELLAKDDPQGAFLARSMLHSIEKHRVEEEQQAIKTILTHCPDAILVLDLGGTICFANPAAVALFDHWPKSIVGATFPYAFADGQSENIEIVRGKESRFAELRTIHFEWRARPAILAVIHDVTLIRQLNQQILDRQREKMEAIARLATGVAHDFRNLLTIISSGVEALTASQGGGEKQRQLSCDMQDAVDKASRLTSELFAIGRSQLVHRQVVNVNNLVNDASRGLQQLTGPGLALNLRLCNDPCMIQVHPTHFEQIIMNLALNARDAAGPDGTLTIATDRSVISEQIQCSEGELAPQPYVVVTVTDDGIGMDESTLARIFEPFFTTKHADEGSGIGLATVYGLMTQNEGVIDVQSVPGHGTTFRLYFPEFQTAGARGPS